MVPLTTADLCNILLAASSSLVKDWMAYLYPNPNTSTLVKD